MTQSIAASLSVPPSRLVRMTSTTSNDESVKGKVLATERERQHFDHRLDALGRVDEHVGSAVLPQQLPAPSARHQELAPEVHAGERQEASAAGRVQGRAVTALGAQPDP